MIDEDQIALRTDEDDLIPGGRNLGNDLARDHINHQHLTRGVAAVGAACEHDPGAGSGDALDEIGAGNDGLRHGMAVTGAIAPDFG